MPSSSSSPAQLQSVDVLVHALWILTGDGNPALANHCIALTGDQIVGICPSADAEKVYVAARTLNLDTHVVMPGLINAHGHCPMTLFRGFADDMPLRPWLEEKIWPAESRWVSEEFVRDGAELAMAEMLLSGITSFCDMYFFPEQVALMAQRAHMRVQLACPVLDFPTVWAQNADEYIRKTTTLNDEYRNSQMITTAFGPHAPYTVSDGPLAKIAVLAAELDMPVHIHAHENRQEIEDSLSLHGKRPLQRLYDLGLLSPSLQAVHMTQLTPDEIELLSDYRVNVVHCPSSNLKLGSGACPVTELLQAGVNVCLGTDGAASNNDLDLLGELHLASLLAKHHSGETDTLPALQAITMATLSGARCLGLEAVTGSLTPGKQADITAIDLDYLNTSPHYDPASAIVYSARASQVSHVWVAGREVVSDGELQTLDRQEILQKARFWSGRIAAQ